MNYQALLINLHKERHISAMAMASIMRVSLTELLNFEAGIPVSDRAESKIISWIDGVI
jgi:hypothetical protein